MGVPPPLGTLPFQQFHSDEGPAAVLINIIDRADIRMTENGSRYDCQGHGNFHRTRASSREAASVRCEIRDLTEHLIFRLLVRLLFA
jgi:hypothetical protein